MAEDISTITTEEMMELWYEAAGTENELLTAELLVRWFDVAPTVSIFGVGIPTKARERMVSMLEIDFSRTPALVERLLTYQETQVLDDELTKIISSILSKGMQ